MILPGGTLSRVLEADTLSITPLDKERVQPAGMDIRLGNTFNIVEDLSTGVITLKGEVRYKTINIDAYILPPGQLVPTTTMEHVSPPDNLTTFVEGRSPLGRLGLFIRNVGWVDPDFRGEVILKLFNANRCTIRLKAGRRIGQLAFVEMDNTALKSYNGKYQGQKGITESWVYTD